MPPRLDSASRSPSGNPGPASSAAVVRLPDGSPATQAPCAPRLARAPAQLVSRGFFEAPLSFRLAWVEQFHYSPLEAPTAQARSATLSTASPPASSPFQVSSRIPPREKCRCEIFVELQKDIL